MWTQPPYCLQQRIQKIIYFLITITDNRIHYFRHCQASLHTWHSCLKENHKIHEPRQIWFINQALYKQINFRMKWIMQNAKKFGVEGNWSEGSRSASLSLWWAMIKEPAGHWLLNSIISHIYQQSIFFGKDIFQDHSTGDKSLHV